MSSGAHGVEVAVGGVGSGPYLNKLVSQGQVLLQHAPRAESSAHLEACYAQSRCLCCLVDAMKNPGAC